MGRKSREKAERKRREEKALRLGAMYGMGASHNPAPIKGTYNVGGTVTGRVGYNTGPVAWGHQTGKSGIQMAVAQRMMQTIQEEQDRVNAMKTAGMCGDCIGTKMTGGHDPQVDNRRTCQLCGTLWPGREPWNQRRQAIADQKARKR